MTTREKLRNCAFQSDNIRDFYSDGWTNIKDKPLINVIASNDRGSIFLNAKDFAGVETTGKTIVEFLTFSSNRLMKYPSNVLQMVMNNAGNCKAAGREI